MISRLVEIIEAADPAVRDRALAEACAGLDIEQLLGECKALERYRRESENLYQRVRALFFLYAIHRFELPRRAGFVRRGHVPYDGWRLLLQRRFEEALSSFLEAGRDGANDAVSSALAAAYHGLGFQTLADQVRRSVRSARGNQWMFRIGHPLDQPLRIRPELAPGLSDEPFPILRERTAVRMDLTHSGWSDIFFLGMDFPEGARVINTSVDLGVRGRDTAPRPPIECSLRLIDEPVLRLVSVDLDTYADIREIEEVFDFAKDYLGLIKAGVIASGIVPPGVEGSHESLAELLEQLAGPGRGIEVVSHVRDIPKGSRLAVSTNLLASLISVCMRATGQTRALAGTLTESERRIVASRAILGEWLGGSGGGWQDSGGIWPGIKVIRGQVAVDGDPEYGISRGRLLPAHEILGPDQFPLEARNELQKSLVLFHGGMAQNVGPVLEMVTEKYLLRCEPEWSARGEAIRLLDEILLTLAGGDLARLAWLTDQNFKGPIQTIIPWATNLFTETVIERVRKRFGAAYRGFAMLGGMSGGGMGLFFEPGRRDEASDAVLAILSECKRDYEDALPFAMEPVVYDFAINDNGTLCDVLTGEAALLSPAYYASMVPGLLRADMRELSPARRKELDRVGHAAHEDDSFAPFLSGVFERMLPRAPEADQDRKSLDELLAEGGFDRDSHERVRQELRSGRIGLSQNRLPTTAVIEDVREDDVFDTCAKLPESFAGRGRKALEAGEVGVITFAAGAASRWTQGAGVVKALNPFSQLGGKHRSFLEVHLAKTRKLAQACGVALPHVFTTSLFTHEPIRAHLERVASYGYEGPLRLSPGRAVGLRMVPMERDLRFLWEETAQQVLDEQAQKVRESLHAALIAWAQETGEGSDYVDNLPTQCLHPVGHWYEIPNLLRNGVLAELLSLCPNLRWLFAHNIDTVGATADAARLGAFIERGRAMSFEVVPRRIDDVGGGLARVDGRARLVEGLAMPDEESEFGLSYYNTGSSWIDLDRLLEIFGLGRDELGDDKRVAEAVTRVSERMPTYVTIKDVKKRWGHGQEDVFPVAQFEKLWGDMTHLTEVTFDFFVVPRERGQQLKDPAQLDGWLRDGSAAYVEAIASFS